LPVKVITFLHELGTFAVRNTDIDWNNKVDRIVAMHSVLLDAYEQAIDLARIIGGAT
jgi:hypothetical protein